MPSYTGTRGGIDSHSIHTAPQGNIQIMYSLHLFSTDNNKKLIELIANEQNMFCIMRHNNRMNNENKVYYIIIFHFQMRTKYQSLMTVRVGVIDKLTKYVQMKVKMWLMVHAELFPYCIFWSNLT